MSIVNEQNMTKPQQIVVRVLEKKFASWSQYETYDPATLAEIREEIDRIRVRFDIDGRTEKLDAGEFPRHLERDE